MIPQVLLFGLCLGLAHPATYQYQRQLVYGHPFQSVAAAYPHAAPYVLLQTPGQSHVIAGHDAQPTVYLQQPATPYIQGVPSEPGTVFVYSPDGQGRVVLLRQSQPGWFESLYNFASSAFSNFSPANFWPSSAPNQPANEAEKPVSAEGGEKEKPEKVQEQGEVGGLESVANRQKERYYVSQPLPYSPLYPLAGANQIQFRTSPFRSSDQSQDFQRDYRPGMGALSFQRYLSTAKAKAKGGARVEEVETTSSTTEQPTTTTTEEVSEGEQLENQEDLGPSIAQAKPQAISVAGPGGVAAAAPVATAVVGRGGMALAAPSATAVAGAKGPKGPPSQAKIRAYFRQAHVPGYYATQY